MLPRISLKGLFAVVVWGGSFVATRVALAAFNPFGLVAVRLWAGALLLAVVLKARGGRLWPGWADSLACVFCGGVLALHLLMQAYGLRLTTAVHTGWIIGFIPVTIALGAYLLGKQRLDRAGWSGVAVGTAGILLVILAKPAGFAQALQGDLLQLASCLTWTVYTLAAAGLVARHGALRVTIIGMGVAAAIASVATVWTGVRVGPLTWPAVGALVFLGPICSGVAYYAWFAAQHEQGPARLGVLLYFEPFVALATGALLMNEPVTWSALAGGLCVLFGVWLVTRKAATRTPG